MVARSERAWPDGKGFKGLLGCARLCSNVAREISWAHVSMHRAATLRASSHDELAQLAQPCEWCRLWPFYDATSKFRESVVERCASRACALLPEPSSSHSLKRPDSQI